MHVNRLWDIFLPKFKTFSHFPIKSTITLSIDFKLISRISTSTTCLYCGFIRNFTAIEVIFFHHRSTCDLSSSTFSNNSQTESCGAFNINEYYYWFSLCDSSNRRNFALASTFILYCVAFSIFIFYLRSTILRSYKVNETPSLRIFHRIPPICWCWWWRERFLCVDWANLILSIIEQGDSTIQLHDFQRSEKKNHEQNECEINFMIVRFNGERRLWSK